MGKLAAYVIFDGLMKGIYRKWAIAKQHVIGKNVRHKGYKTMKEAEHALYGSYKVVATTKNLQRSPIME
ncbi:transcriptional activator, partial [Trifolium medium]|nr:transcriptional activator [Trifolium medium]